MWILPILAAATTYYQSKMVTPKNAEGTQSTMNTIMPLMIGYFSFSFPAGVTLYWVLSNVFQIVQQYFGLGRGGKAKEESN